MNYILKIDEKFATQMFHQMGGKDVEYRKQNKSYIHDGDTITFINLQSTFVYGSAKVKKVCFIEKHKMDEPRQNSPKWYKDTYEFVKENYKDERILVQLYLEDIVEDNK